MEYLKELTQVAQEAARKGGDICRHYWNEYHVKGNTEQFKEKSVAYDGSLISGLQSTADIESEQAIKDIIINHNPDHVILGEESYSAQGMPDLNADYLWIVDPLDGTADFCKGGTESAVSVALAYKGQILIGAVYNFHNDKMYLASNGLATVNGRPIEVSKTSDIVGSKSKIQFMRGSEETFDNEMRILNPIKESTDPLVMKNGEIKIASFVYDLSKVATGEYDALMFFPNKFTAHLWDLAAIQALVRCAGGALETRIQGDKVDLTNAKVQELFNYGIQVNNTPNNADGYHPPLIVYNGNLELPI